MHTNKAKYSCWNSIPKTFFSSCTFSPYTTLDSLTFFLQSEMSDGNFSVKAQIRKGYGCNEHHEIQIIFESEWQSNSILTSFNCVLCRQIHAY